jgi:hypothetical protein
MGLLDDAIREHLDLKRRRGADADEVARQENEALGPPQAGQFAPTDDDLADEPAGEEPDATEEHAIAEEEPAAAGFGDEEPWLDDPVEEPPPATVDQPTTEFTPPDAEPEEPSDDVLEETPEFLQETPEHDRLWFEQRPPRDFDFDR